MPAFPTSRLLTRTIDCTLKSRQGNSKLNSSQLGVWKAGMPPLFLVLPNTLMQSRSLGSLIMADTKLLDSRGVLVNNSALHHKHDPPHCRDVFQRIAIERNDVCLQTWSDRAYLIVKTHRLCSKRVAITIRGRIVGAALRGRPGRGLCSRLGPINIVAIAGCPRSDTPTIETDRASAPVGCGEQTARRLRAHRMTFTGRIMDIPPV